MKRVCLLLLLVLLITATGCTVTINGKEIGALHWNTNGAAVEKTEVIRESPDTQNRLNISNAGGEIRLIPWDKEDIQITAVKRLWAVGSQEKLNNLLDEIRIDCSKNISGVEINVRYINSWSGLTRQSVKLEVMVPQRIVNIRANVSSGSIDLSDFKDLEEYELSASSGSIHTANCVAKRFAIEINSGRATAADIKGNGAVKATSGSIKLKNIVGDIKHRASSGHLDAEGLEGQFISDISSGDVNVRSSYLKSLSEFNTTSGNITVEAGRLDTAGEYRFKAASGHIKLYLPEQGDFEITAGSSSGDVESDFASLSGQEERRYRNSINTVVGKGGPRIDAYVTSGHIDIRKLR